MITKEMGQVKRSLSMDTMIVNYYIRGTNRLRMEEIMREWCGEHRVTDGPAERQGRALISPMHQGWTVIYDETVEQKASLLDALGVRLSLELGVYVIAVRIYQREVLAYTVYDETGRVVDEYISDPGYASALMGNYGDMDDIETDGIGEVNTMEDQTHSSRIFKPDIHLLEELSSFPMADADMFHELLNFTEVGVALVDELLEEFALLLGIHEEHIGLGYRDWIEFLDGEATKEFIHIA
jgi:hypothetical protein